METVCYIAVYRLQEGKTGKDDSTQTGRCHQEMGKRQPIEAWHRGQIEQGQDPAQFAFSACRERDSRIHNANLST